VTTVHFVKKSVMHNTNNLLLSAVIIGPNKSAQIWRLGCSRISRGASGVFFLIQKSKISKLYCYKRYILKMRLAKSSRAQISNILLCYESNSCTGPQIFSKFFHFISYSTF
jgi:hypothetical protein